MLTLWRGAQQEVDGVYVGKLPLEQTEVSTGHILSIGVLQTYRQSGAVLTSKLIYCMQSLLHMQASMSRVVHERHAWKMSPSQSWVSLVVMKFLISDSSLGSGQNSLRRTPNGSAE